MAQATVNIRMDEELKRSMKAVCQELGMNMTTAFTIFAKKMSCEHRIPFAKGPLGARKTKRHPHRGHLPGGHIR